MFGENFKIYTSEMAKNALKILRHGWRKVEIHKKKNIFGKEDEKYGKYGTFSAKYGTKYGKYGKYGTGGRPGICMFVCLVGCASCGMLARCWVFGLTPGP